jgi:dihydrolipoamide dehydrogenase
VANQYDLIVLGSGPGGYVAAIRAAQLGLKVGIVERELLGGICLNWGCIPTKALLRSAEVFNQMKHAASYGLAADNIRADIDAVVKRSRGVAKQLNQGVTHLMRKNKITVHMGNGVLKGGGQIEVTGEKGTETLSAKHVIVATGARARDLPFAKADGDRIWTYRHAMVPPAMPTKLLVDRFGRDRHRIASFYNDMGADVTVVEMMDRIVPVEDADVSAFLEKSLTKQGIKILTGAGVESIDHERVGREGQDQEQGRRCCRTRFQPCDRRGWHRAQHREHRPRGAGRCHRARHHRHRRLWPHQCPGRLGHRRRDAWSVAGAQGEP